MAMDFPDMLASSIHDIKNSLSLISNTLSDLTNNTDNHFADPRQVNLLQHEVQRVNNNLVHLLTLYKLGNNGLMIDIRAHNVEELLEEVVASNQAVCIALGIDLRYQCDPDLLGYFDFELMRSVIESSIGNAQRYAKQQILLTASHEDDYLVIRIEDDGTGFPPALLELPKESEYAISTIQFSGRTRLGLLFAYKIAQLHRMADRTGHIQLRNHHTLPGGCFELWLP